jgi:peptidoglycan/LPS O-acetylase OafA/YrhL
MEQPQPERLAFVDALRGSCAFIIVLSHALPFHVSWLGFDPIQLVGRAAIVVFLMVSGFFLPITCERAGSVGRFWLRRLFRLFPAYWLCIAITFGLCWTGLDLILFPTNPTARDWLVNLTMTQEFFSRPHILEVFWTLTLELVIYAAFAVLFALRLQRRSTWLVAALLGMSALIGTSRLNEGKTFGVGGKRFLYFAPVMGLLAYRRFEGRGGSTPIWVLGVGQGGLLVFGCFADHALGRAKVDSDLNALVCLLQWSLGYGVFFLALANSRRPFPSALVWVGRNSYSVYLLHILILSILVWLGLPAWMRVPALFAATVAVGELSYRCVEAPGIALGRALERRWLPRRALTGAGDPPSVLRAAA